MSLPVSSHGKRKLEDKYSEIIINYVRDHPVLYERESANAAVNLKEKKRLWEELAQKHYLNVEDCKVRWRSIRKGYLEYKKRLIMDPSSKKYIHADLLSFLDGLPSYLARENGPPSKSKMIEMKNPTNPILNLDTTVVTADMLMQILQMRQKEEPTYLPNKNSLFQTQDVSSERIHDFYPISVADTSDTISFRLPKFNCMNNPLSQHEKSRISTAASPEDIIVIEDDGVSINDNTVEDSRACIRYLPIDGHNADTFYESSNSDTRIIETQYKETENILKNKSEGLNANLDSSIDSTEKFFDEMGEYVENRFPEDKQQELKWQIWNLLWKKN